MDGKRSQHDPAIPSWVQYTPGERATVLIDLEWRSENDPSEEERVAWHGIG
jgi:carboxylesterase type B